MTGGKIIITGASSGIGEAVAYAFAKRGAALYLVARRGERLQAVVGECLKLGAVRAEAGLHDLSIEGKGAEVVEAGKETLQGLDVLICNAGYGLYGPLEEIDPAQMARLWQVNYQSGYESIHAALPDFQQQGRGHIVVVSSVIGKTALPLSSTYCATKFAQVGMAEALWGELHGSGVEVSLICPGYTKTEFASSSVRTESASMFNRVGGDPPETVARAIVKAVERRKRVVILTFPGRFFWRLNRFFPNLTARLVAWFINRNR
ncbi:MAG TPA: SDR family NAD(P)-dependent oxidoreductase [Acidobacteriota bacterium]|nr:SDR family NAD(P)-dependent oxidoreductase [Acidobacteriota bacterium]